MAKKQKKASKVKKASKSRRSVETPRKSGIVPLGDRVLIRPMSEDEASRGKATFGIIIPDTISKEKSGQGKVVAVGEGKYMDGKRVPLQVRVGDTVAFSKYSYDEVEHKGEEFYLVREENILAVIE